MWGSSQPVEPAFADVSRSAMLNLSGQMFESQMIKAEKRALQNLEKGPKKLKDNYVELVVSFIYLLELKLSTTPNC